MKRIAAKALLAVLVWLGTATGVRPCLAQERVIIRAPAPAEPTPAWLDNEVTRRFVLWQELDADWKRIARDPSRLDFVRQASRVCVAAASRPQEGEPQPGLRARLLNEACVAALTRLPECYARTAPRAERGSWQLGFRFTPPRERTEACGAPEAADELLQLAEGVLGQPELIQNTRSALNAALADVQRASDGQRAMRLPTCERATALRALFDAAPVHDESATALANSRSSADLDRRWTQVEDAGARHVDVLGYHTAESELALRAEADQAATEAASSGDLDAGRRARDGYACLSRLRPVKAELVAAERRLRVLQAQADKEAACLADPACLERRQQREERQLRRMLMQEQREQEADDGGCCKICSKGYACGDSCISRDKACHKGPGCACDG